MIIRNLIPAVNLIKSFEGLKFKPYKDSAGIPTIGIGTTVYPDGKKVTMADPEITEAQAIKYLEHHMLKDYYTIDTFLKKNKIILSDNQFCSILCFAYNLGPGPVTQNGRSLCEALKSGDSARVAQALKLYNKANVNGELVVVNGLVRRRNAEAQLYLS